MFSLFCWLLCLGTGGTDRKPDLVGSVLRVAVAVLLVFDDDMMRDCGKYGLSSDEDEILGKCL